MTAPDVDGLREALADALGALPEAFNYTDYTDEQTTLLTMDVDGIADVAAAVFRPLLDAITAEAEIAGQMKHITADMVRGDQPLETKEELVADLRARISHVEAERDQRHDAWAQSVKNEAGWMRERDQWMAQAQKAEAENAALRKQIDRVKALVTAGCHHCGQQPDSDGDHSCPCPNTDSECLEHQFRPVMPDGLPRALDGDS